MSFGLGIFPTTTTLYVDCPSCRYDRARAQATNDGYLIWCPVCETKTKYNFPVDDTTMRGYYKSCPRCGGSRLKSGPPKQSCLECGWPGRTFYEEDGDTPYKKGSKDGRKGDKYVFADGDQFFYLEGYGWLELEAFMRRIKKGRPQKTIKGKPDAYVKMPSRETVDEAVQQVMQDYKTVPSAATLDEVVQRVVQLAQFQTDDAEAACKKCGSTVFSTDLNEDGKSEIVCAFCGWGQDPALLVNVLDEPDAEKEAQQLRIEQLQKQLDNLQAQLAEKKAALAATDDEAGLSDWELRLKRMQEDGNG